MISNKDLRVEDGNIIINGEKHPLDPAVDALIKRANTVQGKLSALDTRLDAIEALEKTASGNPISLTGAAEAYAMGLSMTIEATQSGSGDPSPENVRPISGLTEGKVTRTGKNLFGNIELNKSISSETGEDLDGVNHGFRTVGKIRTVGYNAITLTFLDSEYKGSFIVLQYSDSAYIGVVEEIQCAQIQYPYNRTLTLNPETTYIRIKGWYGINVSSINTAQFQVTLGTTATAYEPYTATNATITFSQTVYGGSVDFKTGEVTVTHGMVDLGSLNWHYDSNTLRFYAVMPEDSAEPIADGRQGVCSIYPVINAPYLEVDKALMYNNRNYGTSKAVFVLNSSYTDAATFKTAMSGVQLCYELATPTTLTLTPAELELLKGNNTISGNGVTINIDYIGR